MSNLNISLLVVAWLNQHCHSLSLACDQDSISQALRQFINHLREETSGLKHRTRLELMRLANMTPGDLFYTLEVHRSLLVLIAQQHAQQSAQRLAASRGTPNRRPPSTPKRGRLEVPST